MTSELYHQGDLAQFKRVQRLAYDCAVEVASELRAGDTERQAAARLGALCKRRGVQGFFHQPFAWFGDRSGFSFYKKRRESGSWLERHLAEPLLAGRFFPTERRLERGMAAILDVAPIVDGYAADIGYAFALGDNPTMERAKRDLLVWRQLILERVQAGATMRSIYRELDGELERLGYESAHVHYPSRVLGHKVGRLPLPAAPSVRLGGFDLRTLFYFGRQIVASRAGAGVTPLWNGDIAADVPVPPGLWALEPHVRKDDVGAKWEELLVVTDDDAYWLDDDLPHVRDVLARAPARDLVDGPTA
jgi:Xaa-Pro aminopeptidase